MSEASYDDRLGPVRDLRADERAIIEKMLTGTPLREAAGRLLPAMQVQDMPDGGMGSIRFRIGGPRSVLDYGTQIAEASFRDADQVPVSLTLSVDKNGELFELDVFKGDGSPLVRFPDPAALEIIERHGQLGFPPAKS